MITAFLLVLASIAVGLLMGRHVRKRGANKAIRNLGAVASGVLTLLLGALIFGPQLEAPPTQAEAAPAPAVSVAAAAPSVETPRFTAVDADSAAAAKRYVAELDSAIDHSVSVLPGAGLETIGGISRHFIALRDEGLARFGSALDPLGACGIAGVNADALWHARLVAHAPTGADLEQIQLAAKDYQQQRTQCLALLKR